MPVQILKTRPNYFKGKYRDVFLYIIYWKLIFLNHFFYYCFKYNILQNDNTNKL